MSSTLLILEDEPLILMDLEYAVQDRGCKALISSSVDEALLVISQNKAIIKAAILDVSLGKGSTCFPVAQKLDTLGIPFILHSGDLNRHDEKIRELNAELIAKPAPAQKVVAAALAYVFKDKGDQTFLAAE